MSRANMLGESSTCGQPFRHKAMQAHFLYKFLSPPHNTTKIDSPSGVLRFVLIVTVDELVNVLIERRRTSLPAEKRQKVSNDLKG
ncbi:4954_t:CDS:2 [Ambispora leptoticha]|uniref:4954_t:CDS:1 n=1 Tax=Ambispora leptoticha TaxID=144679 RepID=A0A9N9F5L9_9GLOM|nr:4954_t:CDS:2 [Ambispora leptoticha]